MNQYKNKIESLKSLITTNPSSNISSRTEEPERFENTETFKHHKQIIKQEVLDQVSNRKNMGGLGAQELSPRSAANAKIVKPIKGGQSKIEIFTMEKLIFFKIKSQERQLIQDILML